MAKANLKAVEDQEKMMNQDDQVESVLEYSTNIEDQERPPVLPVGEYVGVIAGCQVKFSGENSQRPGSPYLNVKVSIPAENQPADFVEALGSQAPVSVFATVFGCEDNPQSRYNMKQFCEAAGVPGSKRINLQDFVGKEVKVMLNHRKDLAGNPQPNVQKITKA